MRTWPIWASPPERFCGHPGEFLVWSKENRVGKAENSMKRKDTKVSVIEELIPRMIPKPVRKNWCCLVLRWIWICSNTQTNTLAQSPCCFIPWVVHVLSPYWFHVVVKIHSPFALHTNRTQFIWCKICDPWSLLLSELKWIEWLFP